MIGNKQYHNIKNGISIPLSPHSMSDRHRSPPCAAAGRPRRHQQATRPTNTARRCATAHGPIWTAEGNDLSGLEGDRQTQWASSPPHKTHPTFHGGPAPSPF